MYKNILVGYDDSPVSHKALDVAADLAKLSGARLSLVSVEDLPPRYSADMGEVKDEKARQNGFYHQLQREAREIVKLHGIDLDRVDLLTGHVAQTVINHAKALNADLIVMGNKGVSGVWSGLLGTTVDKVSHHAPCSVLIVR